MTSFEQNLEYVVATDNRAEHQLPMTPFWRQSTKSLASSNGRSSQDKYSLMAKYLHRKCLQSKWLEVPDEVEGTVMKLGVILKRLDGSFTVEPSSIHNGFVEVVGFLDAAVAITMSSEPTQLLLQQTPTHQTELSLGSGESLSIVNSVHDLHSGNSSVSKAAQVCLCRQEKFAFIWGNSPENILAQAAEIETRLVGLVWGAQIADERTPSRTPNIVSLHTTPHNGSHSSLPNTDPARDEKMNAILSAILKEEQGDTVYDPERDAQIPEKRPFLLTHAVIVGLAVILAIVVEMACVAKLITEVKLDGKFIRMALVVTIPLFAFFSLFFMIVITGSVFQIFGPLGSVQGNSVYYSAKAPKLGRYPNLELPHVTIQMPVYKEGLKGVVIPTVTSLLDAVKYYEQQGGTASIYVNDDGMQLVKPELAEARKAFYEINHIGWCSRPPHCEKEGENYFLRKGKFKKASNMNYCLDFSIRVEDEMVRLIQEVCRARSCTLEDLTIEEENELYEQARETMLQRDSGKTWAGGNVRLGEVILIVDSDTRVPEDCLLYGALEMHESPEVALLQHASGIMQVVNNVFENGITYFTDLIYTSIQFAVGSGDCAPFVGHNTFIRWKAIQSIAWEEDGRTKFWSEDHVSEDFDVSLRLQMNHFVVRLATYHNGGFKEGVSLTVFDELARWEKYAYGCNELVFNPLYKWPIKGPFTRLFLRFLFSNIKVTSKVTILAYIGTYYAIASALPLALVNYLLVGWFNDNVDQFYIASWKIFVGMAFVFNILSPIGYAMLRHRLGHEAFFWSILEAAKWTPMFLFFFGGISYHLLKAILCHFFSINMEWTTTAKELESSGFRVGLDRIVRDFKYMYLVLLPIAGGMIYLAQYAPRGWLITDFAAIVPLANQIGCHALLPFALGLF